MTVVASWLRQSMLDGIEFVFPRVCLLCDQRLPDASEGTSAAGQPGGNQQEAEHMPVVDSTGNRADFCCECLELLAPDIEHSCPFCAARTGPFSNTQSGCVHCRTKHLQFQSAICLGMYEDELRKMMLQAKWSISRVQIQALAELLCMRKSQQLLRLKPDIIVPIPQHWRQRLTRYFNPSWIIAHTLSCRLSVRCDVHILRRRRRTRPQKRVALSQRFDNQRDAFWLRDAHLLAKKTVLLVDDVLTTVATCSEAARILKSAGAKSCHVAVIGRVLDHSA